MSKTKDEIQKEALKAIDDLQRCGVEISMGVGKTFMALKDISRNFTDTLKVLVVAPKRVISDTWYSEMIDHRLGYLKDHISFTTYRSLNKASLDYDIVYFDECHSIKDSHEEWLKAYLNVGGRIVGLTGTYPKYMGAEKGRLCGKYFPKVYSYNTDEAIGDEILNDYRVKVHTMFLNKAKDLPVKAKTGNDFYTSELDSYNYWTNRLDNTINQKDIQICRIQRMKQMQKFKTKERYAKALLEKQVEKTILFANTQEQADLLCSHSYHSSNKDSDDNLDLFKEGKIMKLSAVEQLNEGVTIPKLKVGIIMHSYANNRKAAQKMGRLLRLNPKQTATVHILCYKGTVDEQWVKNALKGFDQSKIEWLDAAK